MFLQGSHLFYAGQVHYYEELMPGKHPPLTDLATFNRCLQIRRSKFKAPGSGNADRVYELAGLLFCQACGAPLRAQSAGTGTYYRCTTRERGRDCSQTSARTDVVEQEVGSLIASVTLDDGWRQKVLAHLASGEPTAAEVGQKRTSLEGKLARAKELYVSGDIDRDRYLSIKVECENQIASLREPDIVDVEQVIRLLSTPEDMWSRATAEERKQRNRLLFEAVFVENGHITAVRLRKPFAKLHVAEATGMQADCSISHGRGNQKVSTIHYALLRDMRREGYTLQEIGKRFGVSRQRVAQILASMHESSGP